jgi:hypothetical protein
MMAEDCWAKLSEEDQVQIREELVTAMEEERAKELADAAVKWRKIMKERVVGIVDDNEAEKDTEIEENEYKEWEGIINDPVESKDDDILEEDSTEWETDVEEFLDETGNPVSIKEVKENLKQIYDRHIIKLAKKTHSYRTTWEM